MAREGGGIKIGGVRVGCGWLVLLILAALWVFNRALPGIARPARDAASAGARTLVERLLHRPSPAPATPAPTASPTPLSAPSPEETAPSPAVDEAAPSPSAPQTAPLPDTTSSPEAQDLQVGTGKEAAIGKTVRIRYTAEGGLPVDFLFMVGAGEVAPGLEKGVLGMRTGGRRRLALSADAARGPLPGGSASGERLACEVALLEVL